MLMSHRIFIRDNRAVAPVIGFILALGILVLLLAIYQAQIVPQQNAETELEHHQETRDELRSLHNAISAVGVDQEPRFESINLGTSYESRTLGINPPPPAGTIRTEEHNITIANESGNTTDIPTQFIEYQPGYNELDIGSTWYENSVLYFDGPDSVGIIEDQEMISGKNASIISLQNEFQETGTGRITFELYPKNNRENISLPEVKENEKYNITIPTRLDDYWNETLDSSGIEEYDLNTSSEKYENGINALNLSVDSNATEVNSVGISVEPPDVDESSDEDRKDDESFDLTINVVGGAGGSAQVLVEDEEVANSNNAPQVRTKKTGTTINLSVDYPGGFDFCGWSEDVNDSNEDIQIKIDSDKNITATFSEPGPGGC